MVGLTLTFIDDMVGALAASVVGSGQWYPLSLSAAVLAALLARAASQGPVLEVGNCTEGALAYTAPGRFGVYNFEASPGAGYGDNAHCTWTLLCPDGAFPRLEFPRFETESGHDFVKIYEGRQEQARIRSLTQIKTRVLGQEPNIPGSYITG